jgi:DNA sulfur modification protein DndC
MNRQGEPSLNRDPRYCLARLRLSHRVRDAIERLAHAYTADTEPWVVGFSGGKDSSCVLKLLFHALRSVHNYHKPVTVVYCDTGVEIPHASRLALRVLEEYRAEAATAALPISIRVLSPALQDRFFVKVIGRGYPPPTDKFRWCTDRLRVQPITRLMVDRTYSACVVVIGVRENESTTRRATLDKHRVQDPYWRKQSNGAGRRLFVPIINFTVLDVWQTLLLIPTPYSIPGSVIADLYANASGECPTIREPTAAPCGKARFGCWTCTVAKGGTTLKNLIDAGEIQLRSLLEFRLWLDKYRYNPRYRWKRRRNGQRGLGPMTMKWRRMALEKLLSAQERSGFSLVSADEIEAIRREWDKDDTRNST